MRKFCCMLVGLIMSAGVAAAEMSRAEKQAWETLDAQIALSVSGKYAEAAKYFHPELTLWGPLRPVPATRDERGMRMLELEDEHSNSTTLAHTLTPITVNVVGDTAVINALLELLVQPSEGAEPQRIRVLLHNTWVKGGDGWQLLATYNSRFGGD